MTFLGWLLAAFLVGWLASALWDMPLFGRMQRENVALRNRVHSEYWKGYNDCSRQVSLKRHPMPSPPALDANKKPLIVSDADELIRASRATGPGAGGET